MFHSYVKATQCLHNLVGSTQSNISTHLYIHSIKSSGVPTHIKYLGLFCGNTLFTTSKTLYVETFGSPTETHQIATQGVSKFPINFALSILRLSYVTH
ncbi:MAG: hypothetical protein U9Q66_03855 [Patescibacteria group bacterium]|nr:hypothetical protein [Patescibacteria group bacterium]